MFKDLSKDKTMFFKNGTVINYNGAMSNLMDELEFNEEYLYPNLVEVFKSITHSLTFKIPYNPYDLRIITEFTSWVNSIHNSNLVPAKEQAFPNNIIYDILSDLRNKKSPTNEETLFKFYFEGANARKINKGEVPSVQFISTSLLMDAIKANKNLIGTNSINAENFINKYSDINNFSALQNKLENQISSLKKNSLFEIFAKEDILNFNRFKNNDTGANSYSLDECIAKGKEILFKANVNIKLELDSMVNEIVSSFEPLLKKFNQVAQDSSAIATTFAMWDASEWIARLYCPLKIAVALNDKYEVQLNKFLDIPFFNETIERSYTGDFPANERDNDLKEVELVKLFTQEDFI